MCQTWRHIAQTHTTEKVNHHRVISCLLARPHSLSWPPLWLKLQDSLHCSCNDSVTSEIRQHFQCARPCTSCLIDTCSLPCMTLSYRGYPHISQQHDLRFTNEETKTERFSHWMKDTQLVTGEHLDSNPNLECLSLT